MWGSPDPFQTWLNSLNILDILLPTLCEWMQRLWGWYRKPCWSHLADTSVILSPQRSPLPSPAFPLLYFLLPPVLPLAVAQLFLQIIIYPQAILATCQNHTISLYFHLIVSFNSWPQLFHGDPDTLTAAAHGFSLLPHVKFRGEADIFYPPQFLFPSYHSSTLH